jgi:hypothetical protein
VTTGVPNCSLTGGNSSSPRPAGYFGLVRHRSAGIVDVPDCGFRQAQKCRKSECPRLRIPFSHGCPSVVAISIRERELRMACQYRVSVPTICGCSWRSPLQKVLTRAAGKGRECGCLGSVPDPGEVRASWLSAPSCVRRQSSRLSQCPRRWLVHKLYVYLMQ